MADLKVVGLGFHKTGTQTLVRCFKHWGLRHRGFDPDAFALWHRSGTTEAHLAVVETFQSFDVWPWALMYREVDDRFPGTRFVLTRRSSSAVWFESLCKHAEWTGPTVHRELLYGHAMPHGHKAEHVARYEAHNAAVRDHFSSRPGDLLEVCWEEGDGWAELGTFLGLPVPDAPFPHANASTVTERARKLAIAEGVDWDSVSTAERNGFKRRVDQQAAL
jgi:hypothetical protein